MLRNITSLCPTKPKNFKPKRRQAETPADKLNRLIYEKLPYLVTVQVSRELSSYFYYPKLKTNVICNYDK